MKNTVPKTRNDADPRRGAARAARPGGGALRAARAGRAARRATTTRCGKLVEASFALIRETGSLEPSVAAIVERAGLSNQAFYRHFHSKDELLLGVLDEGFRLLAGYLAHRVEQAAGAEAKIRAWIGGVLEQALQGEAAAATRPFAVSRARLAELFPDEVRSLGARAVASLRDALAEAVASGALPGADPERDADRDLHARDRLGQRKLCQREAAPRAEAEHLVEFALAALRGMRRREVPDMEREILFTGIGGQGIQLAAQVLARAALAEGREVMLFGSYGGTMRNGPTDSTLVVADAPVCAPPIVSRAWSAIAMHPALLPERRREARARSRRGRRTRSLFSDPIAGDGWRVYGVPATQLASECGSSLAGALVLVGAYASLTGLVVARRAVAGLAASLPERRRQHRELNERALRAGFARCRGAEPAWPTKERAA